MGMIQNQMDFLQKENQTEVHHSMFLRVYLRVKINVSVRMSLLD
jgi:hypothetical protein